VHFDIVGVAHFVPHPIGRARHTAICCAKPGRDHELEVGVIFHIRVSLETEKYDNIATVCEIDAVQKRQIGRKVL
jgi:hypothetical protein